MEITQPLKYARFLSDDRFNKARRSLYLLSIASIFFALAEKGDKIRASSPFKIEGGNFELSIDSIYISYFLIFSIVVQSYAFWNALQDTHLKNSQLFWSEDEKVIEESLNKVNQIISGISQKLHEAFNISATFRDLSPEINAISKLKNQIPQAIPSDIFMNGLADYRKINENIQVDTRLMLDDAFSLCNNYAKYIVGLYNSETTLILERITAEQQDSQPKIVIFDRQLSDISSQMSDVRTKMSRIFDGISKREIWFWIIHERAIPVLIAAMGLAFLILDMFNPDWWQL